jgi:tetratricopeptide (TPR) repeat protein
MPLVNAGLASLLCLAFVALGAVTVSSCGNLNALESQAPANLQESAENDMEDGEYKAAQVKLQRLLRSEKTNYPARSLLAASYAAQGGVILLRVITRAATGGAEGAGSGGAGSQVTALTEMFPEATEEAIEYIAKAVAEMEKIPAAKLSVEMRYQMGIFQTAYAILLVKRLQSSPEALSAMTADDAALVLQTLAAAATTFGQEGLGSAVSTLTTSIAATPGASDRDKLATWIQASGQTPATP